MCFQNHCGVIKSSCRSQCPRHTPTLQTLVPPFVFHSPHGFLVCLAVLFTIFLFFTVFLLCIGWVEFYIVSFGDTDANNTRQFQGCLYFPNTKSRTKMKMVLMWEAQWEQNTAVLSIPPLYPSLIFLSLWILCSLQHRE